MKRRILLIFVLIVMIALPAFVFANSHIDAKALFSAKCNFCHSEENATTMRDTPENWRETVMRMKNDNGCDITDKEAEIIINYLSTNYGRK